MSQDGAVFFEGFAAGAGASDPAEGAGGEALGELASSAADRLLIEATDAGDLARAAVAEALGLAGRDPAALVLGEPLEQGEELGVLLSLPGISPGAARGADTIGCTPHSGTPSPATANS